MSKLLFLVLPQLLAAQDISNPTKIVNGAGIDVNFDDVLYVLEDRADNPNLLWKFQAPSQITFHDYVDWLYAPPNGLVYVTTDEKPMLFGLSADNGTEKWRLPLPCGDIGPDDCHIDAMSTAGASGSAIVHISNYNGNTGTLLSVHPDGKIEWKVLTGSSAVKIFHRFGDGNEVLVRGSQEGTIQLVDADVGTIEWTVDFSGGIVDTPSPHNLVVGADGTVYALAQASESPRSRRGGYMLVINHDGTIRANISMTLGGLCPQGTNGPIVAQITEADMPNQTFYVNGLDVSEAGDSCALRAFSQDGKLLWTRATNISKDFPSWLAPMTSFSEAGETLYTVMDGHGSGTTTITTLNGADGAVKWKTNVSSPPGGLSHSMVRFNAGKELPQDEVQLLWDDWSTGDYPDNKVHAIQEGKEVWSLTTGEMVRPVVEADGETLTTYIAAFGGSSGPEYLNLFAINQDGTVKWTFSTKPNGTFMV